MARGTLANIEKLGTKGALTGPIQRGDRATIEAHVAALRKFDRSLAKLYGLIGLHTARIAGNKRSAAALLRALR
jgi:predicted short-subunit dehydrogenase-like oxidoreductase (DUF2520 family)